MRLRDPLVAVCLVAAALAGCSSAGTSSKHCLTDLASCSGSCVDLETDHGNCGACGVACASGESCKASACTPLCADSLSACGTGEAATCVDTASDVRNCGACGAACADGERCTLGVCHLGCAAAGWGTCGARCYQLSSDASHCGDCATACPSDQVCSSGSCVATSAAKQPRVIVSITADDTFADQFTDMAPALEAQGMRATFFVNAGRIDVPGVGFLTTAQLHALQAVGHEIGSHGLTHQHLVTTQNLAGRISREVCDSRVDLLLRGYEVRSIAYPFGEMDGLAQSEARRCGYSIGRSVGTVSTSSGTYADTVPPTDALELRAASSINTTFTLEQVQQYVLNAEAHASGMAPSWLVLNFHHICPGATCNPALAWDTDTFRQFTAWLAQRRDQGTVVRTIAQVHGGPLQPASSSGTPLVLNPGFESDLAGENEAPDCWMRGGSGGNTAAWARVAGRSGSAQRLVMSAYTSGSRSLLQFRGSTHNPDYRSCGTPVVPGHTYAFSCWYQSDVRVAFVFYRNDDLTHLSTTWMAGPPSPSGWALKTFAVTIPDTFNTVFFGPYVSSVCSSNCLNGDGTATLLVDDCDVVDQDRRTQTP